MKTVVFLGSVRKVRMGIRAARFVVTALSGRGHQVTLIDPLEHAMPLLDRRLQDYAEGDAPAPLRQLATTIEAADAFVIVSAEYNGSMPPALTNLMDHFHAEYARRPVGLVTYSAGPWGGMRVLPQLRNFATMLGMLVTPAHLPVPTIGKQFDEDGAPTDTAAWAPRVDGFCEQLEWYADALAAARGRR